MPLFRSTPPAAPRRGPGQPLGSGLVLPDSGPSSASQRPSRSPLFTSPSLQSIPSPTTQRRPQFGLFSSGADRVLPWYPGVPGVRHLGLRHYLAGSPRRKAESSSSSYGLLFHFQLLPTSSHENAVTFSYKVQTKPWRGLQPLRLGALKGALGQAFQPDQISRQAAKSAEGARRSGFLA